MPWDGDDFNYTISYINGIIEFYLCLREEATENPENNAAILIYDLARACAGIRLTRKQAEALILRTQGLYEWEIGRILKITQPGSHYRLIGTTKKIQKFLNRDTY